MGATPMAWTRGKLARIGLLAVAALLLVAAGLFAVGAAREDVALDQRYFDALDVAARTLDARRAATRIALHLPALATNGADAARRRVEIGEELRRFGEAVGALGAELGALRRLDDADPSAEGLARAERATARLAALAQELPGVASVKNPAGARERLLAEAEAEFKAIDDALATFWSARRARIDEAARIERRVDQLARIAVFVAGLMALALGLMLTLVAWRSLAANALLMTQLSQLAREDGLTGVANRRTLDERLPQEMARATRQKYSLSVVMIDLDHFKRFNDRRGHAAGDALLRNAAQAWLRQLRPTDLLARYGGEEFTLVLPACDETQAEHMVERLQPLMPERQTFSAGIATWNGLDSPQELLAAADRALLQAKRGGRNRIVISGREPQISLPLRLAS
jgi:diguanylate cyclase (GGDEF)-like protein